jgi:hypothetical protein
MKWVYLFFWVNVLLFVDGLLSATSRHHPDGHTDHHAGLLQRL